jgi:hypothetical protein
MTVLDAIPTPINVLYSIDYEIFWTYNDDEVRVLIEPTERLLRQAEELGVRYTLFVDVLCLFRYRELGLHHFVDAVEDQLRDAVLRGHDVQTHLHPHWLTAERKDRIWSFDSRTFLLGNIGTRSRFVAKQRNCLVARGNTSKGCSNRSRLTIVRWPIELAATAFSLMRGRS